MSRRAATRQAAAQAPREASGWVRRAYGDRASELITELAKVMRAAEVESKIPRTEEHAPDLPEEARRTLHDDLFELRAVLISAEVSADDHDRDERLRAALSVAIGAASSLAGAEHSPTSGYLSVAKPAIDGVLLAAGEPIVA